MAFELSQVIRLKGMIDAVLEVAPKDPLTATPQLVLSYRSARDECLRMVDGSDVEGEFLRLFGEIPPVYVAGVNSAHMDPVQLSAQGDQARLLLAQLSGWLGAWPSADQLLAELTAALEHAEALATEPEEKTRLANLLEGLRGVGHEVAVNVLSAYLERQVGGR